MSNHSRRILFVGNLPVSIQKREVEDLFSKYGPVRNVKMKTRKRPPRYAYVEFEEPRGAEDAICGCNGRIFRGCRLKVEFDRRRRGHPSSLHRPRSNNRGGGRSGSVSRHSNHQVKVTGLPSYVSWQSLKDHMRQAGDVRFAEVFHADGGQTGTVGIVDYSNYNDMKNAIRKLDGSEFRNASSRVNIRVKEYNIRRSLSRSRSRSRSYSRSRSPSRRPAYRSSRYRSRSASSRSRSGSKGRSSSSSSSSWSGSRPRSRSPVTSPRSKRTSQSPKKHSP